MGVLLLDKVDFKNKWVEIKTEHFIMVKWLILQEDRKG